MLFEVQALPKRHNDHANTLWSPYQLHGSHGMMRVSSVLKSPCQCRCAPHTRVAAAPGWTLGPPGAALGPICHCPHAAASAWGQPAKRKEGPHAEGNFELDRTTLLISAIGHFMLCRTKRMAYASKPQPYDSCSPCQEDPAWDSDKAQSLLQTCGNRYGSSQQVSQTCSAGPGRWRMPRWVCTWSGSSCAASAP